MATKSLDASLRSMDADAQIVARRAAKHKALSSVVVRTALAFWRVYEAQDTNPTTYIRAEDDFLAACEALEKFEGSDGK